MGDIHIQAIATLVSWVLSHHRLEGTFDEDLESAFPGELFPTETQSRIQPCVYFLLLQEQTATGVAILKQLKGLALPCVGQWAGRGVLCSEYTRLVMHAVSFPDSEMSLPQS